MYTPPVNALDEVITRFLGAELRRARHAIGLTRAQLIARMNTEIHTQTLASYESGIRQCTVTRLVEICDALGVTAPHVLSLALQRAKQALQTLTLRVDLRSLLRDKAPEFTRLREWAHKRLAEDAETTNVAALEPVVVREMALIFDISRTTLTDYLAAFAPDSASSI